MIFTTISSTLKNVVRSTDALGPPIQLNYKGQNKHQSLCGGCLTLCAIAIICAFASSGISAVIDHDYVINSLRFPNYFA